jgi:hypothetical protein
VVAKPAADVRSFTGLGARNREELALAARRAGDLSPRG